MEQRNDPPATPKDATKAPRSSGSCRKSSITRTTTRTRRAAIKAANRSPTRPRRLPSHGESVVEHTSTSTGCGTHRAGGGWLAARLPSFCRGWPSTAVESTCRRGPTAPASLAVADLPPTCCRCSTGSPRSGSGRPQGAAVGERRWSRCPPPVRCCGCPAIPRGSRCRVRWMCCRCRSRTPELAASR